VDEALRDPISVKMLKMDGTRIMDITGEKPGKKLGYILHALLEEVLVDPGKNREEYLDNRVKELILLDETALKALGDAGKDKLAEEEAAALKAIAREHKVG
jgi:hypothetical protein